MLLTVTLLIVWTAWVLFIPWFLVHRSAWRLPAIFTVTWFLLAPLRLGITWRDYLIIWLGVYLAAAVVRLRRDAGPSVPIALEAVAGMLWLWIDGGAPYYRFVVMSALGLTIAAIVAAVTPRSRRVLVSGLPSRRSTDTGDLRSGPWPPAPAYARHNLRPTQQVAPRPVPHQAIVGNPDLDGEQRSGAGLGDRQPRDPFTVVLIACFEEPGFGFGRLPGTSPGHPQDSRGSGLGWLRRLPHRPTPDAC